MHRRAPWDRLAGIVIWPGGIVGTLPAFYTRARFFASFDGPARAIRCAHAVVESVRELGLEVRASVHTGECEVVVGRVAGIAIHTGARIASMATPGEVLVSSTVKDLVAGSGIQFEDRGSHMLRGVGEWHLYAPLGGT